MKKTKILAVLGILLTMSITACGGGNKPVPSSSGSNPSSDSAPSSDTTPAHTHTAGTAWEHDDNKHWHLCTAGDGFKMDEADHTWVADASKEDVPATCIAGKHFEKCSICGAEREVAIPKDPDAEHTFGEWTTVKNPTCAQGQRKRACTKCGMEEFEVIPPAEDAQHVWGDKQTIQGDAENGYVGYEKQVCSVCGTWKVFMNVADSTLAQGSELKDGDFANTGGYKLKGNNQSFSFKFKFDTLADVKIYQHGCMDNWSDNGNKGRTYHSGGSNGGCNFKFEVNDIEVRIDPDTANARADALVATRADDDPLKTIECPSGGTGYSEYGELFIGEAELKVGDNTFKYVRLGSYNYILDQIIVEVTPVDHVHEAGDNWVDSDDTYHWKNCTHSDGHKMNIGEHDYTGQEWEVVTPSTCTTKGTQRRSCKVCGHWQVEEMPLAEHKLGDPQAKVGDATPYECSECHAKVYHLDLPTPQKLKSDVQFDITGLPAGNYNILLYACAASTTLTQKYDNRYQFKVNDGDYIGASDNDATYGSYGLGTGEAADNCAWSSPINQIAVGADAASFTLHWTNKGYSAFIAAVRLVSVAA